MCVPPSRHTALCPGHMPHVPSPAFSRFMVQAACPGAVVASSWGDAGGSSVASVRDGHQPCCGKTCTHEKKRAPVTPDCPMLTSPCHPTRAAQSP